MEILTKSKLGQLLKFCYSLLKVEKILERPKIHRGQTIWGRGSASMYNYYCLIIKLTVSPNANWTINK